MFETFLIFPFGRAEEDAGRACERASGIPTSTGISPCCCWHVEYFHGNSRYLRNCFVLPSEKGRIWSYFRILHAFVASRVEGYRLSEWIIFLCIGGKKKFSRFERKFDASYARRRAMKISVLTPGVLAWGPNGYLVQSSFSSVVVSKRTTAITKKMRCNRAIYITIS